MAFDVDDLETIAQLAGVDVASFFGGNANGPRPDGPDGGQRLPRLDSNQQPSGYTSSQVGALRAVVRGPWRRPSEREEQAA